MVGAVRDRLGDLPADRAAALAHDRRPPRARPRARPPAAHAADPAGALRARVPRRSRSRCAGRSRTTCSTARATLYWILVVAVLAYAASYFARGWLAGHQWFGLYGGLVFLEATRAPAFALAVAVGIAEGQSAVALGMAAAPFVSLVVVPWAFSRRPPAQERKGDAGRARRSARGGRFALAVLAVMLAEQTLLNAAVLLVDVTADGRGGGRLRLQRAADRARAAAALPGDPGLAPPPPRRPRGARGARRSSPARSASRCSRSPASRAPSRSGSC